MENVGRNFANLGRDRSSTNCLPDGPETIMNSVLPKKIIHHVTHMVLSAAEGDLRMPRVGD